MRQKTIFLAILLVILGLRANLQDVNAREHSNTSLPLMKTAGLNTLCLEVEQIYPQISSDFSQPISEAMRRILRKIGLNVVLKPSPCDSTLSVTLTGTALKKTYRKVDPNKQKDARSWKWGTTGKPYNSYTGASYQGHIRLTFPGRKPISLEIKGREDPPTLVTGRFEKPSNAPFEKAWPPAILEGLFQLWNSDVFAYALSDKNRYVREAGIKAFQKKGSKAKDAEKALIRTLEHEQWHVRAEAAKALGFVGQSEDVISALIRALKDDHNHVRIAAVGAIGKIGPKSKDAVSALIRSIGDKNEFVRRASITAIGNIGPAAKEAVPVLVQALQGENSGRASTALGKIGSNAMDAVPALIKALEYGEGTSKDLYYRRCAAKALKEITKQNFGKNISLWKQWWKQSERH